jgi:hypothetical protein
MKLQRRIGRNRVRLDEIQRLECNVMTNRLRWMIIENHDSIPGSGQNRHRLCKGN